MNDIEIDLMQRMLEMDPHKRITSREAIDHPYFDELRIKDPEYANIVARDANGYSEQNSSIDVAMDQHAAPGQIQNSRMISPDMLNKRPKQQNSKSIPGQSKNNFFNGHKQSQSINSHGQDNHHLVSNGQLAQKNNGTHNNQKIPQTNSGSNFMNLQTNIDPLHQ